MWVFLAGGVSGNLRSFWKKFTPSSKTVEKKPRSFK